MAEQSCPLSMLQGAYLNRFEDLVYVILITARFRCGVVCALVLVIVFCSQSSWRLCYTAQVALHTYLCKQQFAAGVVIHCMALMFELKSAVCAFVKQMFSCTPTETAILFMVHYRIVE